MWTWALCSSPSSTEKLATLIIFKAQTSISTNSSADVQARSWTPIKASTSRAVSVKIASLPSRSSRKALNSTTLTRFKSRTSATLPAHSCHHLEVLALPSRTIRFRHPSNNSLQLHLSSKAAKIRVYSNTCCSSWHLSLDSCYQDRHCCLETNNKLRTLWIWIVVHKTTLTMRTWTACSINCQRVQWCSPVSPRPCSTSPLPTKTTTVYQCSKWTSSVQRTIVAASWILHRLLCRTPLMCCIISKPRLAAHSVTWMPKLYWILLWVDHQLGCR